ncbi:MAG: DUF134 domain-containing protein [Candidatus Omnitrophica bacterium]|nr:DUF134 domain-containing protein [Candidatus Omnitrophota bacterium]
MKTGRPRKKKIVNGPPRADLFVPNGRPGKIEEVLLNVEEFESIRLGDFLNMPQGEAATGMNISQQSFSRLLKRARNKVSDAIVNAKTIRIEGGDYLDKRSLGVLAKLKRRDI